MLTILKSIRWILLAFCVVYLAFSTTGLFVYFFFEPDSSFIELIKTFFELGLWLSIPVLVCLLLLKSWYLAVLAAFFVVVFGITFVPQLIPREPDIQVEGQQLRVMTFNLEMSTDGIAQVIRDADADVVAVQELSQESAAILAQLESIYPYQALHPQSVDYMGQGILSRYPITADEYWEYPNVPYTLGHQRVEIDFNGTPIVVYNTHPWPPLGWESGYNDESHRVVLEDIAERTFAEEMPLILAGDFNMTDSFAEYDLLATRFTDSYHVAGNGIGYTYPNYKFNPFPPILRLDYIWHSPHFQSVESIVMQENGGSDHSPVVSTLIYSNGRTTE